MLTKDSFSFDSFFYATKNWKTWNTIFTQGFPSKRTNRYYQIHKLYLYNIYIYIFFLLLFKKNTKIWTFYSRKSP